MYLNFCTLQVAILSLHQLGAPNWTNVVFGVISDPLNAPINPVPLSVLKSSFIGLFLRETNLTLTPSIFGQPTMFQILKFPGGVTVIPSESASIWQVPQIQFNFTLNNSILDVEENFVELRYQLKDGLHLRSYEVICLDVSAFNTCRRWNLTYCLLDLYIIVLMISGD